MNIVNKIKVKFREDRFLLPVILVSGLFFVMTSILPFFQNNQEFLKFFSPDENANYIFAQLYQDRGNLHFFEKYNLIADDIIVPRSYFSWQGVVKPVSFLGMTIIYGEVANIFGSGVIPFLTPLFAAIALLFYYLIIKKMFGDKVGFFSFLLLFSFPVFIYYSARSMFHNILFLSFIIISIYFLLSLLESNPSKIKNFLLRDISLKQKNNYFKKLFGFDFVYSALAGLFLGLAIGTRASELIWLAPAGLVLLIFKYKKISFFRLAIFFSFIFLALMPVLYNNQVLYNSPFYGGYYEMNKSIEGISQASGGILKSFLSGHVNEIKNFAKSIFNTIFYFGFHPRQSLSMFNEYCLKMFWWLFGPAIIGLIYLFFKQKAIFRKVLPYGISWVILSLILVVYYGSWKFVDNPDPTRFTIGNSYTRYWLPIYIGVIPLTAVFLHNISKLISWIKNKKIFNFLSYWLGIFLVVGMIGLSLRFVYIGSEEGLKHYFNKTKIAKQEVLALLEITENDSVIITEYHDKFLFPERKVIVGRFNDNNMNYNYYKLTKYIPVYYYNFTLPEADLEYLNHRRLKEFGMKIELIKNINENFSLYKINRIENIN
ncbi:MAG TPA: glycosyltransferase family 39 protein [bacterium]|nr:glycosyltransferase family 39 protein [bacterium]